MSFDESALYTPSTPKPDETGGGQLQLDLPGAPIWNTPPNRWGNIFICNYLFEPDSGKSAFKVDFNRDGDYLDPYEMTINYAYSLKDENFNLIKLYVQGDTTGLIAQVFDFSINGILLGYYFSNNENGIEITFNNYSISPKPIQVDFGFSFFGGASKEPPVIKVFIGKLDVSEFDSVAIVPAVKNLPQIVKQCSEDFIVADHYPKARTISGIIKGRLHTLKTTEGRPCSIVWKYEDGRGNTFYQEQTISYSHNKALTFNSDINKDGMTNATDLSILIGSFGKIFMQKN